MCDNTINLEIFIQQYQQASNFFRSHKSFKYFKNNKEDGSHKCLFDFLDMIYKDNCIHENLSNKEKKIFVELAPLPTPMKNDQKLPVISKNNINIPEFLYHDPDI